MNITFDLTYADFSGRRAVTTIALLLTTCLTADPISAEQFTERYSDWPEETTIVGTVVLAHECPDAAAALNLLPARFRKPAVVAVLCSGTPETVSCEQLQQALKESEIRLSTGTRQQATDWLIEQARTADVLYWLNAGFLSSDDAGRLRPALKQFLQRGGCLIMTGPRAIAAGRQYQEPGDTSGTWRRGLDLIPDFLIQWDDDQAATADSIHSVVRLHPRTVGLRIGRSAALMLSGRLFRILPPGDVDSDPSDSDGAKERQSAEQLQTQPAAARRNFAEFYVPSCTWLPERSFVLKARRSPRQDPNEYLVDLTEWRREAIERTLSRFPPAQPEAPCVPNGTLVIVGGGGMPDGLMQQFIELAGGAEKARLVYVPCSERPEVPRRQSIVEYWKRLGVQHATWIHTKDRRRANTDEQFMAPLKEATGIWFGGGRQWNLADSYYGTKTHRLMKEVLHRGGVIGGSSAGASIQAAYLARATPIQNFRIMAPGYERGGLGFIRGVAIDQHFSQRRRHKDMTQLVNRYPQLLGIGIDEATALIVRQSRAEVVGRGMVSFYDRRRIGADQRPDFEAVGSGGSYDLAARRIIRQSAESPESSTESKDMIPQPTPSR